MKKIILMLVVFLLTLTGCSKERIEDNSKRERKNDKIYVIGENKPYTGTFVKKFENGNLGKIDRVKDGIVHGKQEIYYGDGKILQTTYYMYGKRYGYQKTYWTNGNIRDKSGYYIYGKKIGKAKWYNENGKEVSINEHLDVRTKVRNEEERAKLMKEAGKK